MKQPDVNFTAENPKLFDPLNSPLDMNPCFRDAPGLRHFRGGQLASMGAKESRNVRPYSSRRKVIFNGEATIRHNILAWRQQAQQAALPCHLLIACTTTPHIRHIQNTTMGANSHKEFYGVVMFVARKELLPAHQARWPFGEHFGAIDHNAGVGKVQEALDAKARTRGRKWVHCHKFVRQKIHPCGEHLGKRAL